MQLSHLADLLPNALLEDFVEPNRPEEPLELADEEPFTEEPQVFDDWRNADEVEFIFGQVLFSSLFWKIAVKDQIESEIEIGFLRSKSFSFFLQMSKNFQRLS